MNSLDGTQAPEVRVTVDPWDPGYAGATELGLATGLDGSAAPLNLDLEAPAARWAPVSVHRRAVPRVLFVDGVRRIEARLWIQDGVDVAPGIAASYAAGVVCCDGDAAIQRVRVERGLFSPSAVAADLRTPCGEVFRRSLTATGDLETLSAAMQSEMRVLEIQAALAARDTDPPGPDAAAAQQDLLVVDGPLRGRENLARTIGYIKTHRTTYLPASLQTVITDLAPGERTPVFTLGSHWIRHTWYLRLPGEATHPWAGIVRCECSAQLDASSAADLANRAAATLPVFASHPMKDGRAPQNLYPIAGLERHLRHRLGDRSFIYRELRQAAAGTRGVHSPTRNGASGTARLPS